VKDGAASTTRAAATDDRIGLAETWRRSGRGAGVSDASAAGRQESAWEEGPQGAGSQPMIGLTIGVLVFGVFLIVVIKQERE
jgi:hypothetical protein